MFKHSRPGNIRRLSGNVRTKCPDKMSPYPTLMYGQEMLFSQTFVDKDNHT